MNVLVTGGAGFIGTNLIKRLLDDGHSVISFDNYTTGKKENEQDSCEYIECDITDNYDVQKHLLNKNIDIIYHLAALARIQPSFKNPTNTFKTNVIGTMNIMEWAKNNNCPVIYAGSSSKHGGIFKNPYTFTKHQGEEVVEMYNRVYGVPAAICRFYNVYGPYQLTEGEYCTVIGIFENQYKNKEELTITGNGEQRRDFTHVFDIVDGFVKCGEQIDEVSGQTFELGRGENHSINVIAQSFDWGYTYIPARPGEVQETLCTDMKARRLLSWCPTIDILDYIEGVRVSHELSNN